MENKETLSKRIEDTPKLRFPEFKDKWKQFKFGDNFILSQGLQVPVNKQFYEPDFNLERFIRIVDVTQLNEPQRYVYNPTGKGRVQDDDIFFVRYGAVGTIGYGYNGVIANNLFKVTPTFQASSSFLYQQFANGRFNLKLKELTASTSMPAINFTALNNLYFWRTNIIEQNKIGNFFSVIDKQIEQQESLLTLLNKYKRGLIPLTFSNKNGCKEFKLKELLQPYTSKNTSLYEPVAVGKYGIRKRSEIYSKILSKDISKNKVIEKNTFVIGMGSKQIDFGILYEDVKYSVSPAYLTFKISKKINPKYLEEYLRNILPILSFKFMIIGARQGKNIDKEGFLNYSIYVPPIDRQNRISDTLIALDKKIEKENELLLLLKQYKQGLLQQMFI